MATKKKTSTKTCDKDVVIGFTSCPLDESTVKMCDDEIIPRMKHAFAVSFVTNFSKQINAQIGKEIAYIRKTEKLDFFNLVKYELDYHESASKVLHDSIYYKELYVEDFIHDARILKTLNAAGITMLCDLVNAMANSEQIKGIGKASMNKINTALSEYDLIPCEMIETGHRLRKLREKKYTSAAMVAYSTAIADTCKAIGDAEVPAAYNEKVYVARKTFDNLMVSSFIGRAAANKLGLSCDTIYAAFGNCETMDQAVDKIETVSTIRNTRTSKTLSKSMTILDGCFIFVKND